MKRAGSFALFLLFLVPVAAQASTPRYVKPYLAAQRKLDINRSLLNRAESEYRALTEQNTSEPSDELSRKLGDLRYKIQALQEDAKRLQSELPKNMRAREFLKDLEAPAAVNVEHDKKVEKKLSDIFSMHEKALGLVADKRYADAAKVYEEIVLISPDDDEAYLLLGHCRLLNADYQKAKDAFMSSIQIDPANAREITRLYENILVENPRDDEAYAHLGFVYWMLEKKEEAKQAFETALDINPENAEAAAAMAGMMVTSS